MANVLATFGERIYVPDITFHGKYQKSASGRYLLAVGESLEDRSERIVLFERDEMLVNKRAGGILHAQVSDSGLFVVGVKRESRTMRSQLKAMDKHGRAVMAVLLCADVASLELSRDGAFMACLTKTKDDSVTPSQLILIDVEKGRIKWVREMLRFIERYEINDDNRMIEVTFRHNRSASYSFDSFPKQPTPPPVYAQIRNL